MKQAAPGSKKMRRLMRALDCELPTAVGYLELLWLLAQREAKQGDVGRWTDEEIEEDMHWQGEPGALVAVLVDTGWLDRCAERRLLIHDWEDHAQPWLKQRLKTLGLDILKPVEGCYESTHSPLHAEHEPDNESSSSPLTPYLPSSPLPSSVPPSGDLPAAEAAPASPLPKKARSSKPLTEHDGLAGDLARLWAESHGGSPEWGRHVVALNQLAKRRGGKDCHDDVRARFVAYLAAKRDDREWYVDKQHSLGRFLQHFDRWGDAAKPKQGRLAAKSVRFGDA